MAAELKHCPFCRCTPDGYEGQQVSCRCGAMGPIETPNDPESAGWNGAHDILQPTIAAAWQSEAMHQNKLLHEALSHIEELTAQLKMVLEREAETQARHDSKMDATEVKLAKALAILDATEIKLAEALAILDRIGSAKTSGGGQASIMAFHAREALAEIKGQKK